jgi:transposase
MAKVFGCREAYENRPSTNPRACGADLWGFRVLAERDDAAAGYFALRQQRFLTTAPMPGARTEIVDGPSARETWEKASRSFAAAVGDLAAGERNASDLWRRLRSQGFRGSARVVCEWATRRRRSEKANTESLQRLPSARTIARLMTSSRDVLPKAETVVIAAIENGAPALVQAREIIDAFHRMLRQKATAALTPWIEQARDSLVASFANGVARDESAVRAAISSLWSNGQTEGQVTKLKLVRRQMYGRAKIDLLQARLIGAD